MRLRQLMTFLALSMLMGASLPSNASTQGDLFDLIDQRLSLMQDVAAWKWTHKVPIENLARERLVLDQTREPALQVGIDPDSVRFFFQLQIDAAKEIQRYWFERYESGETPTRAPDLQGETRPLLLTLGDQITHALGKNQAIGVEAKAEFLERVAVTGLSDPTRHALFRALTEVRHYPDRLTQVRSTGAIRIGTTGDYAPFSFRTADGFVGIDIDMARDLAAALGVTPVFVQTSWPALSDDLAAGKFDIAMSGVSRTMERARIGFFSSPYYAGGKTPIARCEDAARFQQLQDIDQPDVRVIVNPGGTNHRYASEHIHKARLIVYEDNVTIFDEIAAGRADVMITDSIEVRLKTRQYPKLCATMPGKTLTYLDKAYLMPRDIALKEFVSTWLDYRVKDGTVERAFSAHLRAPKSGR